MTKTTETKEIKITPPKGYVIDENKSTFTNIVFKKLPKEDKLPIKWEDIKNMHGYYVDDICNIEEFDIISGVDSMDVIVKNVFATKEQAKAAIALAQLSQLKKVYNGDWEPDWNDSNVSKNTILFINNIAAKNFAYDCNKFLVFKTAELRDEFLKNFKDLIEQAKPLLG